jgi:hypothetical protein
VAVGNCSSRVLRKPFGIVDVRTIVPLCVGINEKREIVRIFLYPENMIKEEPSGVIDWDFRRDKAIELTQLGHGLIYKRD